MRQGEIINLRRTYRLRLARYGFVLEHSKLAVLREAHVRAAILPLPLREVIKEPQLKRVRVTS